MYGLYAPSSKYAIFKYKLIKNYYYDFAALLDFIKKNIAVKKTAMKCFIYYNFIKIFSWVNEDSVVISENIDN